MDTSGASQAPQQNIQASQQASLIRPEQVKKLPHLTESQKPQYEQMVQRLWDVVNTSPQNSENWNKAFARLSQLSKQLMTGMRAWQAQKQQANAAAQAAQAAQAGATNNAAAGQQGQAITDFSQLNPTIQARVNSYPIVFPPTVKQGTQQAQDWLREAKMRFGQALQRLEVGKQKLSELQKVVLQRKQSGQLSATDQQAADAKFAQYRKTIEESNSFLQRFKLQQNQFKQERPPQQPNAPTPSTGPQIDGAMETVGQSAPGQGPSAHTISSAVNAARSQANAAQAATSPTAPVALTQQQDGTPGSARDTKPPGVAQSPYNATSGQADLSGSAQAAIQQQQMSGGGAGPRPLSQSAAVQQAAQAAQTQPQSATTVHGHPPYMQQGPFIKGQDRMKISPQLNTKPHEPVQMAPGRPTLTGGPSGGAIGQMGQPAIPKMPGYVLEGAGNERVLSKNKLNELVREVTGSGPEDGDQLSPESEEVRPLNFYFL